jgi:hypothetical protein
MTTFADQIAGIDDIPVGDDLPLGSFTWMHGNKMGKTPGAFYGKAAEFPTVPGAPWVEDNDRFEGENGYAAPLLKIAVVGYRAQWYLGGDGKGSMKQWITDFQQGAKKQVDLIVLAEGLGLEPMIVTLVKVSKSKPIEQIIKGYREGLLRQASRVAGKALPLWSFWLPIAGQRTTEGKPFYKEFSGKDGKASYVTEPALYLPENAMDELFVGAELLRRGAEIHRQYSDWLKEVRLPPNVIEGQVVEYPQLPAPAQHRNVPQPMEEVDLPF